MTDTEISDRDEFYHLIKNMNPGIIVIKFTADWCGPCKKVKPYVTEKMKNLPDNAMCLNIDVDESFDVYAFLKQKKMVRGVPSFLCYSKNFDKDYPYIPKHSYSGSHEGKLDQFFSSCQRECEICT